LTPTSGERYIDSLDELDPVEERGNGRDDEGRFESSETLFLKRFLKDVVQ